MIQNLWDAAKAVLRRKVQQCSLTSGNKNLNRILHLKQLEKEEKQNPKKERNNQNQSRNKREKNRIEKVNKTES